MNFTSWLHRKHIPDSDRISMLIQAAGTNGIPESELRSAVDLPRKIVDDLLIALIGSRQVFVVERDGKKIYFSRF
jgi:hypothetical protein